MDERSALPWMMVALGCGFAGQTLFAATSPLLMWGGALYVLGAGALAGSLRRLREVDERDGAGLFARGRSGVDREAGPPVWRTAAGLLLAAACVAWTLFLLLRRSRSDYLPPFGLWLAAAAFYFVAVVPRLPRRRTIGEGDTANARGASRAAGVARWLLPIGLTIVALALRAFRVGDIPWSLGGDEAMQGLDAVNVLAGTMRNPFGLGWSSVPAMAGFFFSPGVALFGNTSLGVRAPAVVAGTLAVVVAFFLARRLQGRTVAWITSLLLAAWGYHIHFSRLGAAQIFDTLFMCLALWCFVRAVQDGRRLDWALSGAVTGLSQYAYAGARLTPVVVGLLCIAVVVVGRLDALRRHGAGMLILLGAAVVVASPMMQVAVTQPADYNARIGMVGIFQSGWIDREVDFRGASKAEILFDQTRRAVLSFNVFPDQTGWYGAKGPLLSFVPSVFFLLGLAAATLFRPLDPRLLPMTLWWWFGTILGGVLTIGPPPQGQRLITLSVPVCFFAAVVLERCAAAVERRFGLARARTLPALVVLVAVLAAASVKAYFVDYTAAGIYGGNNTRVATTLGHYADRELGPDWEIVFFGAPRIYSDFATLRYLAPQVGRSDVLEPLQEPPARDSFKGDRNLCFVFLPERAGELDAVRRTFPVGETFTAESQVAGAGPLFIAYRVLREERGRT